MLYFATAMSANGDIGSQRDTAEGLGRCGQGDRGGRWSGPSHAETSDGIRPVRCSADRGWGGFRNSAGDAETSVAMAQLSRTREEDGDIGNDEADTGADRGGAGHTVSTLVSARDKRLGILAGGSQADGSTVRADGGDLGYSAIHAQDRRAAEVGGWDGLEDSASRACGEAIGSK